MQPNDDFPQEKPQEDVIDLAYIDRMLSAELPETPTAQPPVPPPQPPKETAPAPQSAPEPAPSPQPNQAKQRLFFWACLVLVIGVAVAFFSILLREETPSPTTAATTTTDITTTASTTPPPTTENKVFIPMSSIPTILECENYPANYFLEWPYQAQITVGDASFSVVLPLLEPFCEGAKAINQQIRNTFQPIIDAVNQAAKTYGSQATFSVRSIRYQVHDFTDKDILSILITEVDTKGMKKYYTYHLDVATGKIAEDAKRVRVLTGLSYPEYVMRATYALVDYCKTHPIEDQQWLTQLEYSPEALVGLDLLPENANSFTLVNLYPISHPNATINALRLSFDPYAQDARFEGGVPAAYHWFFGRVPTGSEENPSTFASPLFLSAFYDNPEEFLICLSMEDEETIAAVLSNMLLSVDEEGLVAIRELCLPYLQGSTEKASLALQQACADRLPETHISRLQDIPDVTECVNYPQQILLEGGYSGHAEWLILGSLGRKADFSIELPLLEPFCEGAREINAAIKNEFQPIIDDAKQSAARQETSRYWKITYDTYQSGDFLSIVISRKTPTDSVFYTVYNLDLTTGQSLDQEEMIRRFTGMCYPEFLLQANFTIVNHLSKGHPMESEEVTDWLSKLETDVLMTNGHQLYLDRDGTLHLANHSARNQIGFQCLLQIPFDPNACTKEWENWELEAYRWLFSIRADGAYAPVMGDVLRKALFFDPERFLRYLSGSEYWLADTAFLVASEASSAEVTMLRALCEQYLNQNATSKAAQEIRNHLYKYADIH